MSGQADVQQHAGAANSALTAANADVRVRGVRCWPWPWQPGHDCYGGPGGPSVATRVLAGKEEAQRGRQRRTGARALRRLLGACALRRLMMTRQHTPLPVTVIMHRHRPLHRPMPRHRPLHRPMPPPPSKPPPNHPPTPGPRPNLPSDEVPSLHTLNVRYVRYDCTNCEYGSRKNTARARRMNKFEATERKLHGTSR